MRASSSRRRARARASKCARATSQAKTAPRTSPIAISVGSGTAAFPVPAYRLEAARRADARVAAIEAVARHPLVAEREVELHRVGGVDLSEPRRDLLGHLPVARAAARETDRPTDVLDMRVDRHEEPRRRDGGPEAEVGRFAADHPAQEKLQPLAGPAGRGKRKEMTIAPRDSAAREHLAQVGLQERPRELLERRPDRADRGGVGGQEALLERAVAQEEIAAGDAERDQIPRPVEAIPEAPERRRVAARVESPHELRGRRAHRREHAFELSAEEVDAPVGKARREQTDDLAVAWIGIAAREPDGIELDAGAIVELAVEALERL